MPSAPVDVDTMGSPQRQASMILTRMPPPAKKGTMNTAALPDKVVDRAHSRSPKFLRPRFGISKLPDFGRRIFTNNS